MARNSEIRKGRHTVSGVNRSGNKQDKMAVKKARKHVGYLEATGQEVRKEDRRRARM